MNLFALSVQGGETRHARAPRPVRRMTLAAGSVAQVERAGALVRRGGCWRARRLLRRASAIAAPSRQMGPLAPRGASAADQLASAQPVALRDGTLHPACGYGTYKVGVVPASASAAAAGAEAAGATQRSAAECVADALEVGYRFFDCAEFYGNEDEVGEAIAASGVPREDLYLASKCWTTTIFQGRAAVRMQVERTLAALGTEYVDLYCIHWPVPKKHCEAYLELQTLQAEGKIRSLGVSNYTVEDYDELVAHEGVTVPPAINQIEVNPFLYRKRTLAAFHERGVAIQAYRALRDGKAFDDGMVKAIAAKHSRTAAQVLGRWCVQHGVIYIPKSVLRTRMEENAKVFDFALDAGDMKALDSLTTSKAIDMFAELYAKCVNRGTPLDGSLEGVRQKFTCD